MRRLSIVLLTLAALGFVPLGCSDTMREATTGSGTAIAAPIRCPSGYTRKGNRCVPNTTPPPTQTCPDGSVIPTTQQCPVAPPPTVKWTDCAQEGGVCSVVGTANVRYGFSSTWSAPRSVTGSIACSNATWGDPLPGTVKVCQTDGTVAAPPPPPPPVVCPDGTTLPAGSTCPVSPPPPVQCPDGTTVPAGQTCPVAPPPPTGTGCAQLAGTYAPAAWQDRFCVATKACPDYRAATWPGWGGPPPYTVVGELYHVVRGDWWGGGLDALHVVAWRDNGLNFPSGFPGGAYFEISCFQ